MNTESDTALPSWDEVRENLRVVRIPLAVRFRGVTEREAALIRGPHGWAEWSPFLEYGPGEAASWLRGAVEAAFTGLPAPRRAWVPVNATVPAVTPDRVESVLLRYGERALGGDGAGLTVKVKVAEAGQGAEDDVARLAAVRAAVPRATLRVDANMGWGDPARLAGDSPAVPGAAASESAAPEDVSAAVDALERLAPFGLEYAEQPVATVAGLRAVREELARRGTPVRIAADESIRKASDPLRVAREDAADLLVVKYAPLGGARRALRVIADSGLPAVVSSALETSVGLTSGVGLAAALPSLEFACGLGTLSLAEDDVAREPLRVEAGEGGGLRLPVRPVEVDPERADALAVSVDRYRAWEERLRAAFEVILRDV
ncbi:enolase C-terminal domain-like protein [Falsarthrobacter nasiphocae]|uniref:O-succinylbenzoate synthase n=1 Tax=Falsarthrobacter nasiphocae TaxID=189863 RepID=A0AAE3YFW8_9MICC|nr:enolase C-terminal domain-like protein [Falsarthrobacter nasiphocae]MDR6892425.1 O-succinylbenzoate synthase [Falsarthrobacter nasiphocae]